jgi:hypothetical protein
MFEGDFFFQIIEMPTGTMVAFQKLSGITTQSQSLEVHQKQSISQVFLLYRRPNMA